VAGRLQEERCECGVRIGLRRYVGPQCTVKALSEQTAQGQSNTIPMPAASTSRSVLPGRRRPLSARVCRAENILW
jgi:hypothetical protein